ncbi:MAG TPA: hypothetical protein DCQ64_19915 [Candidatus Rokubacteria bacterium]|nr:hypothetical protein [Candidatus Rokubacteria bacterium]
MSPRVARAAIDRVADGVEPSPAVTPNRRLLSASQVGQLLGKSRAWAYRLLASGGPAVTVIQVGLRPHYFIREDDLDAYLAQARTPGRIESPRPAASAPSLTPERWSLPANFPRRFTE